MVLCESLASWSFAISEIGTSQITARQLLYNSYFKLCLNGGRVIWPVNSNNLAFCGSLEDERTPPEKLLGSAHEGINIARLARSHR